MKATITIKVDTKDEQLIEQLSKLKSEINAGLFQADLKKGYDCTIKAVYEEEQ